jgi:site-specific DNA-methyltransferase (adenine-specific)
VKPYYADDLVTLYNANCVDIAQSLPQADLLVMDPPFFMPAQHYAARSEWARAWGDTEVLKGWWAGVLAVLNPRLKGTGSAFVFCDDESYPVFYPDLYVRFPALSALVWNKGRIGMGSPWRHAHEFILHARRADAKWCGSGGETDVLDFAPVHSSRRFHPVDKPDALLAKLISVTTERGDLILDPFAGGGSTLSAAKAHGRRAVGVEIEERYCEVIARRLSQDELPLGGAA